MNIKKAIKRCEWCNSENGDRQRCPFQYACDQMNWIDALKNLKIAENQLKLRKKNGEKKILKVPEPEIQDQKENNDSDFPF